MADTWRRVLDLLTARERRLLWVVFAAIENVARVKTLIIIAHRLSTVRNCHAVSVIDYGRIVASGTYNELMESSERFQEMVKGRD